MPTIPHRIRRGLDLPIPGDPAPVIEAVPSVRRVAVLADDFIGLRPRLLVAAGDTVRAGTPLIEDQDRPGVVGTAPLAGRIVAVHRGERRALRSVVIEVADAGEPVVREVPAATPEALRRELLASGLWTCLRARPFGRTPAADARPRSIFVTGLDTAPLAADPAVALADRHDELRAGLRALALLAPVVRLCVAPDSPLAAAGEGLERVEIHTFTGPHPAGTAGLHIHLLDPVGPGREVWHLDAQDTAAIGRLVTRGEIDPRRVIALGGPGVARPRLLRTLVGAELGPLVAEDLIGDSPRIIAGSVFNGRAADEPETAFLGRFHRQISVLPRGDDRRFLGWLAPGRRRFGALRTFLSAFLPPARFDFTTSTHGSRRTIIPNPAYYRVMPFDLLPVVLLRALHAGDLERAEELGALELIEEDLAPLSFVCPGKLDHGAALRAVLTRLAEGG